VENAPDPVRVGAILELKSRRRNRPRLAQSTVVGNGNGVGGTVLSYCDNYTAGEAFNAAPVSRF